MDSVIYDPLEEFDRIYRARHGENTQRFFERLVKESGVDPEQNRKTVEQYHQSREELGKRRRKRNWLRFFRVLMCITVLLIPLVIWKLTPAIRALKKEIEKAEERAEELLAQAYAQMEPLNRLFTDGDSLTLTADSIPLLSFAPCFSVEQETDMRINYDFSEEQPLERSTLGLLAGHYNENPFLFENLRVHTMGTHTYHGYKTIHWTETYRDSKGNLATRTRSQTLSASVTKPKPFYSTQAVLSYCSQGAPELCFYRDASDVEEKSEKQVEKMVRRGERALQKKAEEALRGNGSFTAMSNTEFEVLFDALDRDNEVQFRTLFTPLAQTNIVKLLRSPIGFGDDFCFSKELRTNRICSEHSRGRGLFVPAQRYASFDFSLIRESFLSENEAFFKAVYFDFAPLWAIPAYQERPVHSLKPIPPLEQRYSLKECEVLANAVDARYVVHPDTKTEAIVKSEFLSSAEGVDTARIRSYSYDIQGRVTVVPVMGGDGRLHDVTVCWDEYLPLEHTEEFFIAAEELSEGKQVIARHNGLCIFTS